jgi:hypothetical protein
MTSSTGGIPTPAGAWLPCPGDPPNQLRWFDGSRWTESTWQGDTPLPSAGVTAGDEWTVVGFVRVDPIGRRTYAEHRPADSIPTSLFGVKTNAKKTAELNAQRQQEWSKRQRLWHDLETERLEASKHWQPFEVPSSGLITAHGGTIWSWCSLLFLMTGQWAQRNENSVVIDSSGSATGYLAAFLSEIMRGQPQSFTQSSLEAEFHRILFDENRHSVFDFESSTGRDSLLTAIFGYTDGVGINRVDADHADYQALLRDAATAVAVSGRTCQLSGVVDALKFLVNPAIEHELAREQMQALDRVRRRYDDSTLSNKLLSRLETLLDLVSGKVSQSHALESGTLIKMLTSNPTYSPTSRTLQQRLTAEYALGQLTTLPPSTNVALVLSDFEDHAPAFLSRLSDYANARAGVTLVFFPRFDGNLRQWVTRSDQIGPLIFRLQDANDAEEAARFLGREHSFVVSQRTSERGVNSSDNWSNATSKQWGQTFSQTNTLFGNSTSGVTDGGSITSGRGGSRGVSESQSETISRSLEFRVEPMVLQSMGLTCAIVLDDDRVPVAIDTYPLLMGVARGESEGWHSFEQRWRISPDEFALVEPTLSTLQRYMSPEP